MLTDQQRQALRRERSGPNAVVFHAGPSLWAKPIPTTTTWTTTPYLALLAGLEMHVAWWSFMSHRTSAAWAAFLGLRT